MRDTTNAMQLLPIASVEAELLNRDIHALKTTLINVCESTSMNRVTNSPNVHSADEEGSGKDVTVGGEFDE
jgi:hypothetical protein